MRKLYLGLVFWSLCASAPAGATPIEDVASKAKLIVIGEITANTPSITIRIISVLKGEGWAPSGRMIRVSVSDSEVYPEPGTHGVFFFRVSDEGWGTFVDPDL